MSENLTKKYLTNVNENKKFKCNIKFYIKYVD